MSLRENIEAQIPRLRRSALALTRDRSRADDLVQDTLERALRKFALYRAESDLRAWLFSIMHNLFVNQVRAEARTPMSPLDDDAPDLSVRATQEDGLAVRDLATALGMLPEDYRTVVLLVGLEELSYEATARVLGIPVGTVMSRLSRGRERLQALMAGERVPVLRRVK